MTIPNVHALVGDAVLAVWDSPARTHATPITPGTPDGALPRPHASLALTTTWGGQRIVTAFRWPREQRKGVLTLSDSTGGVIEASSPRLSIFDPSALCSGLTATAQARLVNFLLGFCRAAFAKGHERDYTAQVRALMGEVFPDPGALVPTVETAPGLILTEGNVPQGIGDITQVVMIDRNRIHQQRILPLLHRDRAKSGRTPMHVMLDSAGDGTRVVLIARDGGMVCRQVRGVAPRKRLLEWLERGKVSSALRDYVAASLAMVDRSEAAGMLEDMQLLVPQAHRALFTKGRPLGADLDLAVSCHASGLFLSGWLRDPHEMVSRIDTISPLGERRPLDVPLFRFPRPDVAEQFGERVDADRSGFIAFLPGEKDGPSCYQHRLELQLRSGSTLDVVPAMPPLSLSQARDAVLGAMPPAYASERALAECIAPAAASLHAAYMATWKEPDRVDFGRASANPVATIVVPLYRVLDFLRFQIAAFAIDPSFADVELVYVLDSPEQREEVEHLLLGLHALYGLPMTLLVQSGNFGFSSACNAGSRAARAPAILFLNSDVIPDHPGWLPIMLGELTDPLIGAVGPKLMFDDQSLQHAGMYFQRDLKGLWLNQHYFKGMPRDFAPACETRSVPAVTGAALLMPTDLFHQVGGFSQDFIIGDYEDSDLCLKIRTAGYDIRYRADAELYHLERRSIACHAGYMRGIAWSYNRRLHVGRWDATMEALCPSDAAAPPSNDDFAPIAGAAE